MSAFDLPPARLIEALSRLSWQPPAVVRPYFDPREPTDKFRASFSTQIDQAEKELDRWANELAAARERTWVQATARPAETGSEEALVRLIRDLDEHTAAKGRDIARMRKYFRAGQKKAARISKYAASALQEVDERTTAYLQKELDIRKDFVLFLRALRAELYGPRGGPTFANADDLEAYLNKHFS
ncbi:MAG: hypothetical protein C5B58_10305 [Acidobacteria bacterium]|nr:MAG: hypothetical protein C5B58_10305 [Acidobacteriota bacterium]